MIEANKLKGEIYMAIILNISKAINMDKHIKVSQDLGSSKDHINQQTHIDHNKEETRMMHLQTLMVHQDLQDLGIQTDRHSREEEATIINTKAIIE